ncbi:MAG TPA: carboxypeptidase-like regulatory domain-containing protein [Acidobacteriaceae bacterium]
MRRGWLPAGALVSATLLCPAQQITRLTGAAAEAAKTAQVTSAQETNGTVIGTVEDVNGSTIEGATVTLGATDARQTQTSTANANGFFQIAVQPGRYVATVSSPGLATWTSGDVAVAAGEFREIPGIVLRVMPAFSVVRVAPSRQQIAEEQIHAQEQQRLVGMLPNFYVSYVPNAAPLTTRQKFELAWKNSIDLGSISTDVLTAGVEQAQNSYPAYHQGALGYAKRLGAAYGTDAGGTFIGAAILPTLFHQDPRYFWRGTGSLGSRALYSVSTIAICKGDNRRWQPNYSFVLGNLASGAVSNLYYPAGNRGWATTLKGGAISSLQGISGRLLQEFVMKRFSRGVRE